MQPSIFFFALPHAGCDPSFFRKTGKKRANKVFRSSCLFVCILVVVIGNIIQYEVTEIVLISMSQ